MNKQNGRLPYNDTLFRQKQMSTENTKQKPNVKGMSPHVTRFVWNFPSAQIHGKTRITILVRDWSWDITGGGM